MTPALPEPQEIVVVFVDDEEDMRHGCAQALELAGFTVRCFDSVEAARATIVPDAAVVLVCDVRLPGMHATEWLPEVHAVDSELPMILVTGHGDIAMAVEAMRQGAYDFLEKPFSSEHIVAVVRRAAENRRLVLQVRALHEQLASWHGIGGTLIGRSAPMQQLRRTVMSLASTSADVMIYGETGTGKELVAHCLHAYGERRGGPFVPINCGGLPEALVESELFGYEAGAFTGAQKSRVGKIEAANGGTLFLDEIESMPMGVQVKLLRVLQERVVERLGSNSAVPVEFRVIAASKDNLKVLSDQHKFRADLYYRIGVAFVELPPLRERREDVPLLFEHFALLAATRYGRPAPALQPHQLAELLAYDWPGNLRELSNVAARLVLGLVDRSLLTLSEGSAEPGGGLHEQLAQIERALISETLRRHSGDVSATAKTLSVPKQTLYDKMRRLHLQGLEFRPPGS